MPRGCPTGNGLFVLQYMQDDCRPWRNGSKLWLSYSNHWATQWLLVKIFPPFPKQTGKSEHYGNLPSWTVCDQAKRETTSEGPFCSTFFFSTKNAISHSVLAIWSLIITHFFASQLVFLCHFTGPFILWSLFFCLAVVVPGCPLFPLFAAKAHLLHILACLLHILGHARIF